MSAGASSPNRAIIVAFLVGGFALIAVSTVAQRLRNPPAPVVPTIVIPPRDTSAVTNPATLRFVTDAQLQSGTHGWMSGSLHPHALIDQLVVMPMGADISHIAGDTFSLALPRLSPGSHTVRIFWADAAHLGAGDSAMVTINIGH